MFTLNVYVEKYSIPSLSQTVQLRFYVTFSRGSSPPPPLHWLLYINVLISHVWHMYTFLIFVLISSFIHFYSLLQQTYSLNDTNNFFPAIDKISGLLSRPPHSPHLSRSSMSIYQFSHPQQFYNSSLCSEITVWHTDRLKDGSLLPLSFLLSCDDFTDVCIDLTLQYTQTVSFLYACHVLDLSSRHLVAGPTMFNAQVEF